MIWITIIMGLVQALPTIISLIATIVNAIHAHPGQPALEAKFHSILSGYAVHKDAQKTQDELKEFSLTLHDGPSKND